MKLNTGPFPARCPSCSAHSLNSHSDRGYITRSVIKALCNTGILSETEGQRFLLQQVNFMVDEKSTDFQYSMSKPCPNCTTPIAHYKGHGCHHIRPGGGCPGCRNHFCYTCLATTGLTWTGCPNGCSTFCSDDCDCPTCLDCEPGNPCGSCEGPGHGCPVCS